MVDCNKSASPAIHVFRRYVTDYVNAHDFSVLPEIMTEDYTLDTSGMTIVGRDGAYRAAVASQLKQFPGLTFTPHELFHCGDVIGIRFTEHGASAKHQDRVAAWPSIAIYRLREGRLARCAIEQDYFSRRRQLETGLSVPVDPPALAPWDTVAVESNPRAERAVTEWLAAGAFLETPAIQVDDSRATGRVERIVAEAKVDLLEMASGGNKVAFHALQRGRLAEDFGADLSPVPAQPVLLHMSGLVTVERGGVTQGNVIRDRWGLYRRLERRREPGAQPV